MTKRNGNFEPNNGKKPKLLEDDAWEDDLDEEAMEKCFQLASQYDNEVASSQICNASLLPSYNSFKNPSAFSTSTQAVSNNKHFSLIELQAEIRRLKQENEEKEGEISILRNKVKEAKASLQVEQQRSNEEWKEKLGITQKEVKSIKSNLEFKNLEIANLKQQISELRRHSALDSSLNLTQTSIVQRIKTEKILQQTEPETSHPASDLPQRKQPILECSYPLRTKIIPSLFEHFTKEKHIIKTNSIKLSRNTIPYLKNQAIPNDSCFKHKCYHFKIDYFYHDILKLVNTTKEELNNDESNAVIKKTLSVTFSLLEDLKDYLKELGESLKTEDIQQADNYYLLNGSGEVEEFSSENFEGDELGIKSGAVLSFLTEVLPYNNHLMQYVCHKKILKLPDSVEQNNFQLFNIILDIVRMIGKYRKAFVMSGFLCSVTKLLTVICRSRNYDAVHDLCYQIFSQIVFSRPKVAILYRLTFLLKSASYYPDFIQFMFKKENKTPLQADLKRVLYYTEGACPFCVFCTLLQNTLLKVRKLPVVICINMLSFMYNTFKTSHWIHHNSKDVCICLSQLYKLVIEIVFVIMEMYVEDMKHHKTVRDEYRPFLKHQLISKVLSLMSFNNSELTEKFVIVYAQYKEIERILRAETQPCDLKLNTSEEVLRIPESNFLNIDF